MYYSWRSMEKDRRTRRVMVPYTFRPLRPLAVAFVMLVAMDGIWIRVPVAILLAAIAWRMGGTISIMVSRMGTQEDANRARVGLDEDAPYILPFLDDL